MVRFIFSGIAIFLCWSFVWKVLGQQEVSGIRLVYPTGLALNRDHDLYISDIGTHQVLRLTDGGELVVIAGTGAPGFGGDGGPSEQAQLFAPHDIAFDSDDNLLIADTLNHRVRRIDGSGVITTVAGNGVAAAGGDDGPAVDASLNGPQDLEIDREGAILIADTFNIYGGYRLHDILSAWN